MTIIEQIKTELERRIALYSSLSENTVNPNRIDEDRQILSFLSTLESENPVPNDLKEAVKNYIYKAADSPGDDWTTDDIRNAFIAGYKLHEANIPLPEDTVLFNKGVAAGKRLMIEEAVEGEVILNPYPMICLDDCKDYDFKDGDEVRIIIV